MPTEPRLLTADSSSCAEWLFMAQPQSVPEARRLVAISLHHLPVESLDVVLLLTSELMSNAVLPETGPVGMRLGWDGAGVRVGVTDQAPRVPVVRSLDLEAMGGRGLMLVEGLSSDWGVQASETGLGKTVWFTLDAPLGPDQ